MFDKLLKHNKISAVLFRLKVFADHFVNSTGMMALYMYYHTDLRANPYNVFFHMSTNICGISYFGNIILMKDMLANL